MLFKNNIRRRDREVRCLVIDEPHVSLEALGRELGVLRPWEKLSDD